MSTAKKPIIEVVGNINELHIIKKYAANYAGYIGVINDIFDSVHRCRIVFNIGTPVLEICEILKCKTEAKMKISHLAEPEMIMLHLDLH